jgi:hypothetical protein
MAVLCLATIAATLAAIRLWRPTRREPFLFFAAGEAVGFAAGAFGSSAAVTRAGGSVAGCALLFLLVLVRMADLVRENEATVRELRGTEGVLRASLSERDALAAQLEHQAFHDSLTDLANRRCSTTGCATP